MKLTSTLAAAALIALVGLSSCQTTQAPIPVDATSDIYFQRAQAATEVDQYAEALKIYQLLLERHPDANNEDLFSARYEIALLHKKMGKPEMALKEFQSILADYDDLTKSAGAPAWVRILSEKLVTELKSKLPKNPAADPQATSPQ